MAGGNLPAFDGISRYAGGTRREQGTIILKAKTTTSLRCGVYVIKDTTDAECQVAGAGAANAVGVIIKNLSNPEAADSDTPAAGDELEIALVGSGAWVWARNKQNIALGDAVSVDTGGAGKVGVAVTAAAGDFRKMVGKALIDNDGSGTESDILLVI